MRDRAWFLRTVGAGGVRIKWTLRLGQGSAYTCGVSGCRGASARRDVVLRWETGSRMPLQVVLPRMEWSALAVFPTVRKKPRWSLASD